MIGYEITHSLSSGAFMLLYVMLLLIIGVPLFFMELAAGQSIRQGSIGVWKHISPRLAGIGYSSCMVKHTYTLFMRITSIILLHYGVYVHIHIQYRSKVWKHYYFLCF